LHPLKIAAFETGFLNAAARALLLDDCFDKFATGVEPTQHRSRSETSEFFTLIEPQTSPFPLITQKVV
jgi:hypothetical protein